MNWWCNCRESTHSTSQGKDTGERRSSPAWCGYTTDEVDAGNAVLICWNSSTDRLTRTSGIRAQRSTERVQGSGQSRWRSHSYIWEVVLIRSSATQPRLRTPGWSDPQGTFEAAGQYSSSKTRQLMHASFQQLQYGLDICRQCFRERSDLIGFKKER